MQKSDRNANLYRKRRVFVIAMLVAVIVIGVGIVWFIQADTTRAASESVDLGIQAFEIGDYEQAVTHLNNAIEQGSADADVITKLAVAKLRVGGGRPDTQQESLALLERAIMVDADHLGARRALMMLYLQQGRDVDGLEQAQFILARSPRDAFTFKLQTEILTELGDFEGLLDAARTAEIHGRNDRAIAVEAAIARSVGHLGLGDEEKAYEASLSAMTHGPLNTRAIILWLDRLERTGHEPDQQIDALSSLIKNRPKDPRPVKAYALACRELSAQARRRNDPASARRWFLNAVDAVDTFVQQDQVDQNSILSLASELDHLGRSRYVFQTLTDIIDRDTSLKQLKDWALRGILLEAHGTVIDKWVELFGGDLADQIDTSLAGMVAYCAKTTGQDDIAQVMQKRLKDVQSPVSDFWLATLSNQAVPQEIIESYLIVRPRHPVAEFMLAEDEFANGQNIDASRRLRHLAIDWPGWNKPAITLSRYYRQIAKPKDELAWAERAKNAAPDSLDGVVVLLDTMARYPQLLSKEQADYGLTNLDRISDSLPEDQRDRLRVQFGLLSSNPDEFVDIAQSILKHQVSAQTAISLSASAEASGNYLLAADLLNAAFDHNEPDHPLIREMVRLHLMMGEAEQAKTLCESLLQSPTTDDLLFVASVWKSLDEPKLFEQAIELAPSLIRAEADTAYVICKMHEISGDLPAAIAAARSSLGFNPNQSEVWKALLRLELSLADDRWRMTLTDAAKVLPAEQLLISLHHADPHAMSPIHRSAVLAALREPQHASAYIDLIEAKDKPLDRTRVDELLGMYPLATGLVAIRLDQIATTDEIKPHVDEIMHLTEAYLQEGSITRRTTALFMRAGDYELAKFAADAWRRTALSNPIQVDIVRADIRLRLEDHNGAAKILSPYFSLIQTESDYTFPLIALMIRIELVKHDPERAWLVMEPYLDHGTKWRGMATQFATQFLSEPVYVSYWLDNIYQSVPKHSNQELFKLANAYASSFQRFKTRLFRDRAIEIWSGLVDDPALSAPSSEAIRRIRNGQ
ncbi:MAG: hypothetical protein AAGI37_16670 [Planctomycetota bacterium]